MQKHTERLGTAPLGRLLIALSLPGIVGTLTISLYNIVDTIWVAQIGHEAIAALTIVFPYQILFYAIGGGTGIGVSALVSRRFGEKNIEATNHIAGQIFFISAVWGCLFLIVAALFADSLLPVMGATPDIIEYARQYMVITSYGAPLIILAIVTGGLLRGSGDAVKPMIIMILGTVVNIILDPLMILGIGPFPQMGVSGAAWATFIAHACSVLLGLYYIFRHKTSFRIQTRYLRPDMSIIRDIYHVGAPTMVLQIAESFAFLLFNRIVSTYESIALATVGIIARISDFAFMPVIGVSHGLLPIVGFNFGARNIKRLWQAVKLASVGITVFLAAAVALLLIFAPQIVDIFSDDPAFIDVCARAMRIMLAAFPLIGPWMMIIAAFQGLSKGKTALVLSLIRQFIVFIPALYLLNHLFGLDGIFASLPTSDIIGFVIAMAFILVEYRKHTGKSNELKT